MQHLRTERSELQHLIIGDLIELAGVFHQPRVGGIHTVHIGIDLAEVGMQHRRQGDGARIRPAAPEGRHIIIPVKALKARHDHDVVLADLVFHPLLLNAAYPRAAMVRVGHKARLPAG